MFNQIVNRTREITPLIHNITNYVSANACANITLACGASPIMAEDIGEVEEVTALAAALVINTGMMTESKRSAMLAAGKCANELGHPVILDPVGMGVSMFRTDAIRSILREVRVQVIRGNNSEIRRLADSCGIKDAELSSALSHSEVNITSQKGVDVSFLDEITEDRLEKSIMIAKKLAISSGAIIVATGAIDIITDGVWVSLIRNGSAMLKQVSGSGCMLSSLIGAYCGANPNMCYEACVAAVGAMGLCGESAYERMLYRQEGSASLLIYLLDYMSQLDGDRLMEGIKLEAR